MGGGPLPESPTLRHVGSAPRLRLYFVRSLLRPGELSLRVFPDDETWVPVFQAFNAAGFEPGDFVELSLVSRGGAL